MRNPILFSFALGALTTALSAQNQSLTYQGRLQSAGMPVNGAVDLRFGLWDAVSGGTQLQGPLSANNVIVVDGLFTVQLGFNPDDFMNQSSLWLEIAVANPAGSAAFVTLNPRQSLSAVPYALSTRGFDYDDAGNEISIGDFGDNIGMGTSSPDNKLHVVNTDRAQSHVAMFENQSRFATADGICIKINNGRASTNRENNFITFKNGQDTVVGRVEGFDLQNGDWIVPPPIPRVSASIDVTNGRLPRITNFDRGALPTASFSRGSLPTLTCTGGAWPTVSCSSGSFPNLNCTSGTLPSLTFDDGSLPSFSPRYSTVVGIRVMTGFTFSTGNLPDVTWNRGSFPNCSLSGGSFPSCSINTSRASFPTCTLSRGALPSLNFSGGRLPSLTFDPGALPIVNGFDVTLPTVTELQGLMCWAAENGAEGSLAYYASLGLGGSSAVAGLVSQAMQQCKDEGVVYGSRGADYAEWLPKEDPDAHFQLGQVVGVRDGKVTLETAGAEQLMVVSCKPIVLGNIPPTGDERRYVKVAFMGQVPVVVRGKTDAGDFIVPSGEGDGTAVAVAPADLEIEHLDRIVGRAWSSSVNSVYGMVNVVVGVEGYEGAFVLRKQHDQIESLRATNDALRAELDALRTSQLTNADRLDAIEDVLATLPSAAFGQER